MQWLQADALPCLLDSMTEQHWHQVLDDGRIGVLVVTEMPVLLDGDSLILQVVQDD